jgi:hypothetical protein
MVMHSSAQNSSGQTSDYGEDTYESGGAKLNAVERRGRDTWYFWTGGDQRLWRQIAIITNGATDLLQYVDSRRNGRRFRELGAITEPGCRKAVAPDEYGLWLDECPYERFRYSADQQVSWVCKISHPILIIEMESSI